MRAIAALLVLAAGAAGPALAADDLRFAAVDIYLHSAEPVAAWQFELSNRHGAMQVVGVENGDSDVFRNTPYYDREAVRRGAADRIIVADYSLADVADLPSGRIRIATIHLMLAPDADAGLDLKLLAAVAQDGRGINATISLGASARSEE